MENSKPCLKNKTFYLQFKKDWFEKNDIIETQSWPRATCKVVKVYKNTWWRRLLRKLGFNTRICQIKVVNGD